MPDLTTIATLGAIVFTLVNAIRFAKDNDWSSVASQIIAWVSGAIAAVGVAHTGLAQAFVIGGVPLAQLGVGDQLLLGLMASSAIGVAYQFKNAIDTSDSAVVPSFLPTESRPSGHERPETWTSAHLETR